MIEAALPRRFNFRDCVHEISTLKIRVKPRLSICWHRSFEFLMWGFACLTAQEDEANA
jgi:hypothetical protein